jgi:hypothetical protein
MHYLPSSRLIFVGEGKFSGVIVLLSQGCCTAIYARHPRAKKNGSAGLAKGSSRQNSMFFDIANSRK